ncbi:carbohydrate ABC transporter permease [Occultella aeris]|uniref:Lactose transport system permease protein LacF n=1 Tax=Occultella aeris TaxID=2761496 RepID=A0A7M4DS88_9MICO|nr:MULTISPECIES: sugar ABC transporter permease [Occultella]VZO40332.1 Lactose transport system permease protein LacF [Occultella aeris]
MTTIQPTAVSADAMDIATDRVTSPARRRDRHSRPFRKPQPQEIWGWIFVLVPMLLFLTFVIIPVVMAVVLSFTDYAVIGDASWVGLENYQRIAGDPIFLLALRNTAIYTLMFVPLGVAVALGTALLLNRNSRAVKLFRTFFYIPVVASTVATATIWYWLLNPQSGLFNIVLGWFGINGPAWLYDSKWAMTAIVLMSVWSGFGTNMLIYLGGLQGIARELYEAVRIDGANVWQTFRYITIPGLSRTTFLISTLLIIGAFQVFDQAYLLTKGGPGNSTLTVVYYIYNQGFGGLKMGYASALSFVLFLIIAVFSLINFKLTSRSQS